jgi:hypothetical protein
MRAIHQGRKSRFVSAAQRLPARPSPSPRDANDPFDKHWIDRMLWCGVLKHRSLFVATIALEENGTRFRFFRVKVQSPMGAHGQVADSQDASLTDRRHEWL